MSRNPGRPKNIDGADTRAALLAAAEVEFGARGFHRARLEDIASAANIRRSSLLYHFGAKEQLYREVVLAVTTELRAALDAALAADGSAAERVESVANALLRFAEEHRSGVAMFVRELLDPPPASAVHMAPLIEAIDLLEAFFRDEVGSLLPDGAPIRAAILHILTSQALRTAAGELGEALWGPDVDPRVFLRALQPGK